MALLALAAAVASTALLVRGDEHSAASKPVLPLAKSSLVRIDPRTSSVVAAVAVGESPDKVTVGDGSVWTVGADGTLAQVDPENDAVVATSVLSASGPPEEIATDGGSVWVLATDPAETVVATRGLRLWRFRASQRSYARVSLPGREDLEGLASGGGFVWIADWPISAQRASLVRIRPDTGRVSGRVEGPCCALSVGAGAVWALTDPSGYSYKAHELWRTDLHELAPTDPVGLELGGVDLAAGKEGVWLALLETDEAAEIDPQTGRVLRTVRVGRLPRAVAVGAGSVWVANERDRTVTRIDPGTLDTETIAVGGVPTDIAAGEGGVWVTVDVQ